MRIVADLDLCQGHAMCVLEAPEVFAVEDQVRLLVEHPTPEQHAVVREAVRYCPTMALTLLEDD